jgi:hypothetical protein
MSTVQSDRAAVTAVGAAWLKQQEIVSAFRAALPTVVTGVPSLSFDGDGFTFAGARYAVVDHSQTWPVGYMTSLEVVREGEEASGLLGGARRWVDADGRVYGVASENDRGGGHQPVLKPTGQTLPADAADVFFTLLTRSVK